MIISDLNYLENVSATDNLRGANKIIIIDAPITQTNVNITLQDGLSFFGSAKNKNHTHQSNKIKF